MSKSKSKTQTECRAAYKAALANFLSELSDIDNETPWSAVEPGWWLEMKAVESAISSALAKFTKE